MISLKFTQFTQCQGGGVIYLRYPGRVIYLGYPWSDLSEISKICLNSGDISYVISKKFIHNSKGGGGVTYLKYQKIIFLEIVYDLV